MVSLSRRTVRRAIVLGASAVALNYIVAWLAAGATMWASPPTGRARADWVASLNQSRSTPKEEKSLRSQSGWFIAFGRAGVLARGTSLMWTRSSFDVESGVSASVPISRLDALPEFVEPRYRAEFRRWADTLNPVPGAPMAIYEENSFGFPLHGLGNSLRTDYSSSMVGGVLGFQPDFTIQGGINASSLTAYRTPRPALILPLVPRWPEFLINTAFWAGILWLIFGGAAMLRGMWRTRHGRCAKCNYDLRGLAAGAPCPECGSPSNISAPSPA